MKRFFCFLSVFCLIFLISLPCSASDTEASETEEADFNDVTFLVSEDEAPEDEDENTCHTLFSRLLEYAQENEVKLISIAGSGIVFIAQLVAGRKGKKNARDTSLALKLLQADSTSSLKSQDDMLNAVNGMIESYNAMRAQYEKYEAVEDERNRLISALVVLSTANLEIISSVYQHSKNMPQKLKDYVFGCYANAEEVLRDDEALLQIFNTVRDRLREGIEEDPATGSDSEAGSSEEEA